MAEPAVTLTARKIGPATRAYPLATRTGISMLTNLLTGDRVWSRCTPYQRQVLTALCEPLIDAALAAMDGPVTDGQTVATLPADGLPALPDGLRSSTVNSLSRAGLVDACTGRITPTAVHAWYWGSRMAAAIREAGHG